MEENFAALDAWFDRDEAMRLFRPSEDDWNMNQVLEHVMLTNHYLLIIIRRGTEKCLRKAANSHNRSADGFPVHECAVSVHEDDVPVHEGTVSLREDAASVNAMAGHESDLDRLEIIGRRGTFAWDCPPHMRPSGEMPMDEIRSLLGRQREECLEIPAKLSRRRGALHRIKMSVNNCGRLDLYQWLYFLTMHAARHLDRLRELESLYRAEHEDGAQR